MRLRPSFLVSALLLFFSACSVFAAQNPAIFPLSRVHPGMKGEVYTIFSGDQIQKVDLVVLGVLKNAMGPREDIILVQLLGPEVEKTGVVAGMSGSPVYFDGKLAGALSLKIGQFSKDAIAGVTPIQNMLDIEKAIGRTASPAAHAASPAATGDAVPKFSYPHKVQLGPGEFLTPIETPLVFSGVSPETIARFAPKLAGFGMAAMVGGTTAPQPGDSRLQPGDMVGMGLVSGDLSVAAGCTVTAVIGHQVFVCGHPLFGFGSVALPMTRAHVVTTLASSQESTKIMNTGGTIGTITEDRTTAVMGRLGAGPGMIPVAVNLVTPSEQKHFHFHVVENPKLTPLLVALSTYNGVVGNPAYAEGMTLQLDGRIVLHGHPPVHLQDMFVPSDSPVPDGLQLALSVESAFARIYTNPYEQPKVNQVTINVTSLPQRRWASIDGAWADKGEVHPGSALRIKVLLRPYRGAPFLKEIPVTIPAQAAKGNLRILVSDASALNRMTEIYTGRMQNQLQGLNELIRLINRERRNDRLYVTLLQNSPTLMVEDKELPNVPASEINVLDQHRMPGGALLVYQSVVGQHSVEMNQVISGQQYISIQVK